MRILFFGDGEWAAGSLRRLVDDGHDLAGVVLRTGPSHASLANAALELRLPMSQPANVNTGSFVARVREIGPDLNLSVSYDQILRKEILSTAPRGFVNFHAGMLPNYRGRNVVNWALINGEKVIGLTGHYVDEEVDTGDIILQRTVPISWTDTYGDLLDRLVDEFPDLVGDTVLLLETGDTKVTRQPAMGTYFPKRREGDEWLDWTDTSRNLYNKVRAITRPGPGARTLIDSQVLVVWRAVYEPDWPTYRANPGQVVGQRRGEGVLVKTGDSVLLVCEAELGGTGPFVPGWRIGTRLGTNLTTYVHSLEDRLKRIESRLDGSA